MTKMSNITYVRKRLQRRKGWSNQITDTFLHLIKNPEIG